MKTAKLIAATALASASVAASQTLPVPLGNPGQWFGSDAYPPPAIRAEAQGRVQVAIDVDMGGAPTRCTLLTSTGNADLDAKSCEIAMTKLRFDPARDVGGKPTTGIYKMAVRWVLPKGAGQAPGDYPILFTGTGKQMICTVSYRAELRTLAPAACRAAISATLAGGGHLDQPRAVLVNPGDLEPLR